MQDLINDIASFLREHGKTTCYAWTAAILVIYGKELSRLAKSIARAWHFVFRVLFFVLVCGFCYGMLTVFVADLLHHSISQLSNLWYIVAVVSAFFTVGFLADRKKQI